MPAHNNHEKIRLDQLLVERGLAETREKAQRLILAGEVLVDGKPAPKAGTKIPAETPVSVKAQEKFVSRGGLKLEAALSAFRIDPTGRTCIDIGASTGGFTDCLLQNGASRIYAYDVGHGQLHWKIRQDPRVVAAEGINARHLQPSDFPETFSLAVADVSFISLTAILPPVFALLEKNADMVVLIKPQFELSKEKISRGGIVRDAALHEEATEKIRSFVESSLLADWCGLIPSPILGAKGNREFLAHLRK